MDLNLLTRKEVCSLLKISIPSLHRLVKSNRIKPVYVGALPRFKSSEVERFIQNLSSNSSKNKSSEVGK